MNKQQLINELSTLIERLKKDSVSCKWNIYQYAGSVEGIDEDNWMFKTHCPDGNFDIDIEIEMYDSELDESEKVFIPTLPRI